MKLFKFIWETCNPVKKYIYGILFCTFLVAVDSNLRPYLIKLIINQENFNWPSYAILAFAYILSQICSVTVLATNDWLGTKLHTNYRKLIAHKYLDKLTSYPYSFFQETQSGLITSKITDAFNTIFVTIHLAIDKFIRFLLVVLVTLIILSSISYIFVAAALIWICTFLGISHYFYHKYEPINKEYAKCRPRTF